MKANKSLLPLNYITISALIQYFRAAQESSKMQKCHSL